MNEQNLLDDLQQAALALHMSPASDLRSTLPRHPTERTWRQRSVADIKGLVWHQELGWGTVEQVAAYHTGPTSHLKPGGVESISYTWAIRRNGQIVLCNDLSDKTWSQGDRNRPGDENAEFMSVMMEGLFTGPHVTGDKIGEPTQEQLLAALLLWRVCAIAWGWDQDDLYGHYHFGKPACPGYTASAVIEAFRKCPVDSAPIPPPLQFSLATTEGRQQALIDLGHLSGEADGIWGPMSKGALITFQQANGLVADGVWGKNTERAMVSKLTKERGDG